MRLNNKGFGFLGILLVVVVIMVIVAGGMEVYHHDHKTKDNAKVNTASDGTNSNSSKGSSKTSALTSTTYMDITQWGVKVPLSSPISGLYYVVSTSSGTTNGTQDTIWLGLKSITSTECTPTPLNTNNTEIASINRALPTDTDAVSGQLLTQKYPNGTTINGYYYALDDDRTLNSNCAPQSTLNSIDAALQSSAKNITQDKFMHVWAISFELGEDDLLRIREF